MNSIILNSDHTFKLSKNLQKSIMKYYDLIKYILIPISNSTDSFIIQKPNKYMKIFHHATVQIEFIVIEKSFILEDYGEKISNVNLVSKEFTSLLEFYQYLHSLNRIRYFNKISNSNESAIYDIIDFSKFQITIYDKENKVVYKKDMNLVNQKGTFGVDEILIKIQKVYDPILLKKFTNKKFTENLKTLHLVPIFMPYTKSVLFYPSNLVQYLSNNIKSLYGSIMVNNTKYDSINLEDSEELILCKSIVSNNIRFCDYWSFEIGNYVEYITYINYMNELFRIISNVIDENHDILTYEIINSFEIEVMQYEGNIWNQYSIRKTYKDESEITIQNIIQ